MEAIVIFKNSNKLGNIFINIYSTVYKNDPRLINTIEFPI